MSGIGVVIECQYAFLRRLTTGPDPDRNLSGRKFSNCLNYKNICYMCSAVWYMYIFIQQRCGILKLFDYGKHYEL